MKKRILLLVLISLLLLTLIGCGSASKSASSIRDYNEAGSAPAVEMADIDQASEQNLSLEAAEKKIIKNAEIRITVKNNLEAEGEVQELVAKYKGYIQNSESYKSDNNDYTNMEIRLPAENFEQFNAELADIGEITNNRVYTTDVTEEYIDLSARQKTLSIQEQRLQEMLTQTKNVDELLKVERELARVRGEIERITGRLRYLDNKISYSTVRPVSYTHLPHAPYTCTPDYLERVMKLADSLKVGLHIHLAETLTEVENITKEYGLPPIKLMDSLGLFDGRHVLAAHCVHLTEEEIDILVKKKVGIAHNPESNMKLASGIAPIPQLLAAGALVGLGTDGASSNNNLDMIGEMHTCALLHKVATGDPTVLSAYQVLEMATLKGAQALGLEKLGSLQPGYKADLIMLDLHKAHLTPHYDPIANLVYAAHSSDVKTVIIDGNLVMKDYQLLTIDEERVIFEAERLGQDLISRQ